MGKVVEICHTEVTVCTTEDLVVLTMLICTKTAEELAGGVPESTYHKHAGMSRRLIIAGHGSIIITVITGVAIIIP